MKEQCRVNITYKNEKLETVCEKDYSLEEYLSVLRLDLLKIIMDVEDMGYAATGNRPKEFWNEDMLLLFSKIRHKLLDKAGEVERLPKNMRVEKNEDDSVNLSVEDKERETLTTWIAKLFQSSEQKISDKGE